MRKVYHVSRPNIVGHINYKGPLGNLAARGSWTKATYENEEAKKLRDIFMNGSTSFPVLVEEKIGRTVCFHMINNLYPSPEEARVGKIFENSIKFLKED